MVNYGALTRKELKSFKNPKKLLFAGMTSIIAYFVLGLIFPEVHVGSAFFYVRIMISGMVSFMAGEIID